ncbi:hypothetical protein ACVQK1_05455 [Edwardsiella tarda]
MSNEEAIQFWKMIGARAESAISAFRSGAYQEGDVEKFHAVMIAGIKDSVNPAGKEVGFTIKDGGQVNMSDANVSGKIKASSLSEKQVSEYICCECGDKISAHVFERLQNKKWTPEQLDEWKKFQNKEEQHAADYILKTRSGLVNLIEGLRKIEDEYAKAHHSACSELYLKKRLRAEVKVLTNNLLALI